jgi:L-fucose isomerase-like protein
MKNVPQIRIGLVAVSRDCFPIDLSRTRRDKVMAACTARQLPVVEIPTIIENESHAMQALEELQKAGANALVLYLGNFGPEGPTTILAQRFDGPVMVAAAAEETGEDLYNGRGDAYCGMLNNSYNMGLRKLRPYVPEYPVGTPDEVAEMIAAFLPAARIVVGLKHLKIFGFGPRPQDFLACNAPIKPLYDLGVEIMENSELDLYDICLAAKDDPLVAETSRAMAAELGTGNSFPDMLARLAQYEVALRRFMENNLGASRYGIFANKCWPAFEKFFGHVPCYINSRLAADGIPVACEVDIYGALSEYVAACATLKPPAILDINNTVPRDMYAANQAAMNGYGLTDLFMGFHCGNCSASCMVAPKMKYQLIMHRLMEPGKAPEITRGTLEGQIKPGPVTIFRLQSTADTQLKSYIAQGEVLDVDPRSFGSIGIFAIPEMGRFYRHVLIEKRYPHHTAVAFGHVGHALFAAARMLGVPDIAFNLPKGLYYPTENPF